MSIQWCTIKNFIMKEVVEVVEGGSYPVYTEKEFMFLENFVVSPDRFYYLDEYGRIQGMFASEFEAATAYVLQYFGIIPEFVEGLNLHVKSNFGLKSIDFRVFYVNSKQKLASFLIEAHPWTRIELLKSRSNVFIDERKFNAISRPDLHGERYYFLESVEDLYKLIYGFCDHLEQEEYNRKIYNIRGQQNIINFRMTHLKYKKVNTDFELGDRTNDCEDLLRLVDITKLCRCKKIRELSLLEFREFFEECKSLVHDASNEVRKRIKRCHINFVREFTKLHPKKPITQYNMHNRKFKLIRKIVKKYIVMIYKMLLKNFTCLKSSIYLLEFLRLLIEFYLKFNYFAYIAEELKVKFKSKNVDEVWVRRIMDVVIKEDGRERFKGWFYDKIKSLYLENKISDNVFLEFERTLEYA